MSVDLDVVFGDCADAMQLGLRAGWAGDAAAYLHILCARGEADFLACGLPANRLEHIVPQAVSCGRCMTSIAGTSGQPCPKVAGHVARTA